MKIRHLFIAMLAAEALIACGANQAGLKAQAASDMHCKEDDVDTSQVSNGYAGDDFGARFKVECGGEEALYEKKGPGSWAAVEETQPMPEHEAEPESEPDSDDSDTSSDE